MRKIAFLAVILLSLVTMLVSGAYAASNAVLKADVQDGFIRLVFTGDKLPKASVTESGDTALKLTFDGPVSVVNAGVATAGISPVTTVSADATPGVYTIQTGAMVRHRTLALGNRLFVDIYTSAAPKTASLKQPEPAPVIAPVAMPTPKAETPQATEPAAGNDSGDAVARAIAAAKAAAKKIAGAAAPKETPKPATAEPAKAEVKTEAKPEPAKAEAAPAATSIVSDKPVETPKAATAEPTKTEALLKDNVTKDIAILRATPPQNFPTDAAPATIIPAETPKVWTGSALITIGSTQGIALAAFVRSGYLWMVLSQEQLSVAPQISGPDASALRPLDLVKIDGGSAYRVKLPEGAYVRPEGAGLVWRLYIEGKKPNLRSVTVDRDFSDTSEGPQVHIPLSNAVSALRLPDPLIGDDLAVITVGRAESRLINSDSYVDFDMLPAIVGAVVRPKADGIRISVLPTEVVVARQGGLRMSATGPRPAASAVSSDPNAAKADGATPVKQAPPTTIFAFKDWALGGPKQYIDMRHTIDDKVASAPEDRKLPELINGAKFMLAQGLPQEATGFLTMASSFMPTLRDSGEFQAISGAVSALKGDEEDALDAFATAGLENLDEIALWKAYATARNNQLPEAQKLIPVNATAILATYPARLQAMLLPPLVEAILARGDINVADTMIDMYDKASEISLDFDRDNAIAYYRGRIAALRGDMDASSEYYREAADGLQGPYPVRATLALVERGLSAKTIGRDDAIRKLERFRYGWRGDSLESTTLERLGLVYVTGGEQRRGLTILRDAATLAQDPAEREKLVAVMQKAFRELYSGKTREKMSPLEAASVAAEFSELMPAGGEGEAITMTIADQMVKVDLLDRAANMIEPMVDRTATLADAIRYAERAAAIRIINDQPDDALKIIDKAMSRPDAAGAKLPDADLKRFALLRAKAKAELKRPDDALAELAAIPEDAESLKLMADISWGAQRWSVAADAFGKLIARAGLSATRPPTHDQAQLVLNEALALNLSGDNARLDALRNAYSDIMRRSDLNQPFQLVTRTAKESTLADRETLLKLVSEVDMFKGVLDTYKTEEPVKPAAQKAVPAPTAANPAKAPPAQVPAKAK